MRQRWHSFTGLMGPRRYRPGVVRCVVHVHVEVRVGGVVGQGVSRAVGCCLRGSGSSQQGGLVQSCLGQDGRWGGESSVGGRRR